MATSLKSSREAVQDQREEGGDAFSFNSLVYNSLVASATVWPASTVIRRVALRVKEKGDFMSPARVGIRMVQAQGRCMRLESFPILLAAWNIV
jgi:hypothetical protein